MDVRPLEADVAQEMVVEIAQGDEHARGCVAARAIPAEEGGEKRGIGLSFIDISGIMEIAGKK